MTITILLVSIVIGTVLVEIVCRTFGGLWLNGQLRQIGGLLQAFREARGDDARQALLLRSGRATLQFSLGALGLLLGLMAIAGLAPWALQWTESQQTAYLVALSVVATGWWILRSRCSVVSTPTSQLPLIPTTMRGNAYGVVKRWLHWLALEPAAARHLAFDLERQFALPKRPTPVTSSTNKATDPADGAVYICGLARSGTTMLLRILDQVDAFRTLTYRDMPFVLAPNLWKQLTRHAPQRSMPAERAHGDGILVDFDSPEGFEEVFWRTFGTQTRGKRCLGADEPSPEVLTAFADYRALVANPRTEDIPRNGIPLRYLSKNNNNLLRLRSLCADPTATVLLVYRDPVATARSLHRQHQRFCAAQTADRFTRTYMGWLAHHEFGLDHLPFCFAVPEMDVSRTPDDLNYWLDYWNAVYSYVLAQRDLRLHLVNHDALCAQPFRMLEVIFAVLGVHADAAALAKQITAPATDASRTDGFCSDLLRRAEATHRALLISLKNIRISTVLVKPE